MGGVVDDDVDAAHELGALLHPLLHGLVVGQVDVHAGGLVALGLQLVGHGSDHAGGAAGAADEGAVGAQQLLGDLADALSGAGENNLLALEALADRLLGADPLAEDGRSGHLGAFDFLCHGRFLSLSLFEPQAISGCITEKRASGP